MKKLRGFRDAKEVEMEVRFVLRLILTHEKTHDVYVCVCVYIYVYEHVCICVQVCPSSPKDASVSRP
jgi:hypothetical protein